MILEDGWDLGLTQRFEALREEVGWKPVALFDLVSAAPLAGLRVEWAVPGVREHPRKGPAGRGTDAARRSSNSSGSKSRAVEPSRPWAPEGGRELAA
jgi:hypothetical protein